MKQFMAAIVMGSSLLAGCSTSGGTAPTKSDASSAAPTVMVYAVSPAMLASFKPGVTTIDQVETLLGKPVGAVRTPSGNQVIAYTTVRNQDVNNDRTPETGTALPKRHKIRYATMLAFDPQGRWLKSWTRTDDLGDSSPTALGHFDAGDVLTNQDGMP